jgi:hypothetical protein
MVRIMSEPAQWLLMVPSMSALVQSPRMVLIMSGPALWLPMALIMSAPAQSPRTAPITLALAQ